MHPNPDTWKAMMQDADWRIVHYYNLTGGVMALHQYGYKF
ncbi:class I SAM-dependent methyltransferase [Shigella flexneri]